jgi:predicted nucleotidyltransferase
VTSNVEPTKKTADVIVRHLRKRLAETAPDELPSVRSVFLSGSYVRGDWLDSSSDLDINILFHSGVRAERSSENDFGEIRQLVVELGAAAIFSSQCPGGIDWGTHPYVPTTKKEVSVPTPYPYFSVFFFDFRCNTRILWGEDFGDTLPQPTDSATLAEQWVSETLDRIGSIKNQPQDRRRAAFTAYKTILVSQMVFGERTLDKTRILSLYLKNVPEFPQKVVGEHIIRGYLGAAYPHRPPEYLDVQVYRMFVRSVLELIRGADR